MIACEHGSSHLRRLAAVLASAAVMCATAACGSSSSSTTVIKNSKSLSVTTIAGAQPAAVTAPASAPSYCQTLSADPSVQRLSGALRTLAQLPADHEAHATLQGAATAMSSAAGQASGTARDALQAAAAAIRTLDHRGLNDARTVNTALQNAGRTLEGACSFPVG